MLPLTLSILLETLSKELALLFLGSFKPAVSSPMVNGSFNSFSIELIFSSMLFVRFESRTTFLANKLEK